MIETPRKIAAKVKTAEAAEVNSQREEGEFEIVMDPPPTRESPPKTMPAPHEKLFDDALSMTVNRNLDDVATLLQWAREAQTPVEKLKHVKRANELLTDVKDSLQELR